MDEHKPPGIRIDQIFLNRAHFEHREDALSVPASTRVDLELAVSVSLSESADRSQGLVTVTVETVGEKPGLYRFQLEMCGLVSAEEGRENISISDYLAKAAGPTMFPFVREALANLTGRGRFGPVWLRPLNFNELGFSKAAVE